MTTFKKLELIKNEIGVREYKKSLKELPKRDKRDLNVSLQFLLGDVIPKSDLDILVERTINNYPMSNSELLSFIIEELVRQGVNIKGKKAYDFLINDKRWREHEKSWYGWLNENTKDSSIESIYIKKKIETKLDFSSELWNKVEVEQKKIIYQKVKLFLEREAIASSASLVEDIESDYPFIIEDIRPTQLTCTQEQKRLIKEIEDKDSESVEEIVENSDFFRAKEENQDFLMKVLPILYKKGLYDFLHINLFPSLFTYNREKKSIKFKEANTLSNIGDDNYHEIYHLLKSIKNPTKEESVDITTMLISNFKRSTLKQKNIDKEVLLNIILKSIKFYKEAYEETHNYYPAINLVYMLKLLNVLFPKEQVFLNYNLETIYSSIEKSIKEDRKRGEDFNYYASISDFEFKILLNRFDSKKELEEELENILWDTTPDKFLVERTHKQMSWFLKLIKEFNIKEPNSIITQNIRNIAFIVKKLEEDMKFL